jgi:hypothetical protein
MDRFQNSLSREVQRNLSVALRAMLSERKSTQKTDDVKPGALIRARTFNGSTTPMLTVPKPIDSDARSKTSMTSTQKKIRRNVPTLRSRRSNSTTSTIETAVTEPISPKINIQLDSVGLFASEAFQELSRYMPIQYTEPQLVKEEPGEEDTSSTGEEKGWEIRSAPDIPTSSEKKESLTGLNMRSAVSENPALHRAVSHDQIQKPAKGSLRASAQRIRQVGVSLSGNMLDNRLN